MFDIDTSFIKYPEAEEEKENNIYYKIILDIYVSSYKIFEEYKKEKEEQEKINKHNKTILIVWALFLICSSLVTASWFPLIFSIIGLLICLADLKSSDTSFINLQKKLYEIINESLQNTLHDELEKIITFVKNNNISHVEIAQLLSKYNLLHYRLVRRLKAAYDSINGDLSFEKLEKGYKFKKFEFGRCHCCNKKDVSITYSHLYEAFFCEDCYKKYVYNK